MRHTSFLTASFFVGIAALAAQQARAETLADWDAKVITAATVQASAVSTRSGRYAKRGVPASFGRSMDPDFRSMVKLAMRFEMPDGRVMTEHCGGTVIDSRWILTAAHCVSPDDGSKWNRIDVVTGDRDLDGKNTIRRTAYEAIIHSGFEYATLSNDIALLRLSEPLPRSIAPARLDAAGEPSLNVGEIARAAGWPITGADAGNKRLQTTDLAVAAEDEMPGYITVASAAGQAEGVCQGESGGPLVSYSEGGPRLAGVLSGIEPRTQNASGEPCMTAGYEMYFTPVASYRKWIDRVRAACNFNPQMCSERSPQAFVANTSSRATHSLASKRLPR